MEFAVNEEGTTYGSQLNDEYYGSPVDDTFKGNGGDDYFDGGAGTDIAIFSGNKSNYTITETGYARYQVVDDQGNDGTDTLRDVETLRFSDQDFDITPSGVNIQGDNSDNSLEGSISDDFIYGEGGDDILKGLEGDDTIYGGDGDDTIFAGDGNDKIYGGQGSDVIIVASRQNSTQNNYLHLNRGYSFSDEIDAGSGNDQLIVGDIVDLSLIHI